MVDIGEYVRTEKGLIAKYLGFEKEDSDMENIVNHSKQPIDLIKVGDIIEIKTELCNSFKCFVENEDDLLLLEERVKQFWNIKKILTHEQFETNCYKVGGEDER